MPRFRIIVLDQLSADDYRVAFWADVPVARQARYADPAKVSAWKDAITADNDALKTGSVAELVTTQRILQGSTLGQIEAALQSLWTSYQATINGNNPWQRYGSTWDGTTWTVANNG